MGIQTIPAPSAGKTSFQTSLTSGTSYTVPAGVTYLNVTLYGGGGGGGVGNNADVTSAGGNGGTTTFTGATSAVGGNGSGSFNGAQTSGASTGVNGSSGAANSGKGGTGCWAANSSSSITIGPGSGTYFGADGAIVTSTLSVTPGASIAYAIGAGGTAGVGAGSGGGSWSAGAGGSGRIDIQYWA